MRKQSNLQFAKALYEVTKSLPAESLPQVVKQFFITLQKYNKLKKIDYILEDFISYSKKQSGIKTIEVETTRELDEKTREKIINTFGAKSEITQKINKQILGGIRIKIDDTVHDASLKTQLYKLKQALIK
ncbi:MAG: F0F1 ATP synthase subunit delta [Candidatus Magasanikbacteria bacterium]|nr:F0F1 ATP synthase subunit delta [Candidatus Magasanikbacteria bacterium]